MTSACSLSDRFRRLYPLRFGLCLSLVVAPGLAFAQQSTDAPGPALPPAPVAAAEPDAAPPPEATGGPSAPPKEEPAPRKKRKKGPEPAAAGEEREVVAPEQASDKKRDKPNKHDLRLKGRVFALAELSHRHERVLTVDSGLVERDRDALDLSLQSARFGVEYRAPLRWLSAEVELEVAGKVRAKDAFVKAGQTFFVKAGQFKVPAAALEVASPWTLPLARRGLVHDLMTDWLDIAGRAPGIAFGYHQKDGLKPRLTLGVFQGTSLKQVLPGDRDVRLIDHVSLEAQTYAARAELSPFGVNLGAWYEQRVGSIAVGQFRHFATFGLDATVERGGLRAWVDGSGGQSPYLSANKPGSDRPAWFAAGRALVAYRFGGAERDDPYLEPFGFFALLDPDTDVVSDMVHEAALGVGAGFWDRARITLQGELTGGQRNLPQGFLDGQEPAHKSLLLQAGARF